jgi:glycosyltransferase involved in cell wall biosynthesis
MACMRGDRENDVPVTADVSVIVPAFNEERYLPATLAALIATGDDLRRVHGRTVELIVVDNCSTDRTAEIARRMGATVHREEDRNISRARNHGAATSQAPILVFVDADTIVPVGFLSRVVEVLAEERVLGGAVDTEYRARRFVMKLYLRLWRVISRLTRMAQGAGQFCRREGFEAVGGYDETLLMGEDVEFCWALQRHAAATGQRTVIVRDMRVVPSARRFDQWPLWRVLLMTNPLVILVLRRKRAVWSGWYSHEVR